MPDPNDENKPLWTDRMVRVYKPGGGVRRCYLPTDEDTAAGERAELEAVQRELEAAARDREPDEAERAIAEAQRRRDLELRAMLAGVDLPR